MSDGYIATGSETNEVTIEFWLSLVGKNNHYTANTHYNYIFITDCCISQSFPHAVALSQVQQHRFRFKPRYRQLIAVRLFCLLEQEFLYHGCCYFQWRYSNSGDGLSIFFSSLFFFAQKHRGRNSLHCNIAEHLYVKLGPIICLDLYASSLAV